MQPSPLRTEFTARQNSLRSKVAKVLPQRRSSSKKKLVPNQPSSRSLIKAANKATSTNSPVKLSPAERAREEVLRADPMALVLGPLYVDCRNCGSRIKLSSKSLYDTCHWYTHRLRCLKQSDPVVLSPKRPSEKALLMPSHLPQRHVNSYPATDHIADTPEPESRPEPFIPAPESTASYHRLPTIDLAAQAILEEYLLRFHGKRYTPLTPSTDWRDWSWSQLLYPRITTVLEPESTRDDGHYMNDDQLLNDSASTAAF